MKKIILIVDDEKEIHELIEEYLSSIDAEFYHAYNGREAVKIYEKLLNQNKRPDIVIMDLNLSGSIAMSELMKQFKGEDIDGVEASKEIMKMDASATIVGFTAYAHLEWGKRLREIGAKAVFGREIGFDGFAEKVASML